MNRIAFAIAALMFVAAGLLFAYEPTWANAAVVGLAGLVFIHESFGRTRATLLDRNLDREIGEHFATHRQNINDSIASIAKHLEGVERQLREVQTQQVETLNMSRNFWGNERPPANY